MQDSPDTNPRNSPESPFCDYPDDGCLFSDCCLNCPLPFCVVDLPPRQVAAFKRTAQAALSAGHTALPDRVKEVWASTYRGGQVSAR